MSKVNIPNKNSRVLATDIEQSKAINTNVDNLSELLKTFSNPPSIEASDFNDIDKGVFRVFKKMVNSPAIGTTYGLIFAFESNQWRFQILFNPFNAIHTRTSTDSGETWTDWKIGGGDYVTLLLSRLLNPLFGGIAYV